MTGMLEGAPSLENMENVDAQINREYDLRYARGAHEQLASMTPEDIKDCIAKKLNGYTKGEKILITVLRLSLYARSNDNPEAILTAIKREAVDYVKDSPTEYHDGTWRDVKKTKGLTQNSPVGNITYLLWEKTAGKYKEINGEVPQTDEERLLLQEQKERAERLIIS